MLGNCVGKEVRGSEGHKLGKVVRCDGDELVVESGIFKVEGFVIPMDEVASVTDGELYLRRPAHQYDPGAPRYAGSQWHSGKRGPEARQDMEAMRLADREHRLGAQGVEGLAAQSRGSVDDSDELESERVDRLAEVRGTVEHDPLTPDEPRGSPPEARMAPVPHPEDEPWP